MKSHLQESQYKFPYHHIPYMSSDGTAVIFREYSGGWDYLLYMEFVASQIRQLNVSTMCDVGCGDGKLASFDLGNVDYLGIDLSDTAIGFARSFNPGREFYVSDIKDYSARFDLVCLVEVLEHIHSNDLGSFLINIHRSLKQGGYLLLTVPSDNTPLLKKHYKHYSTKELLALVTDSFYILEVAHVIKISAVKKVLTKLMSNRYYLLKNKNIINKYWMLMNRRYLYADESNCKKIFLLAQKK